MVDNFIHRIDRIRDTTEYYKCIQNCGGCAILKNNTDVVLSKNHDHLTHGVELVNRGFRNKLKVRIQDATNSEIVADTIPVFTSIKSSGYIKKNENDSPYTVENMRFVRLKVTGVLPTMGEIFISQRKNVRLLKNNYKYSKYTELKSGETGWKCIQKTCKTKLYTFGADNNFSRESGTHEHENIETNIIVRQTINNGIKRKGLDYITDRPSKLIKLEIATNVVAASTLTCKDKKFIRDSISRERIRSLPKLLKSISETLYVDGTFKYCTKFSHQLFSIHAYRNGVFVPVVFCLLPNKNKDTYLAIWEILREKCSSLNKFNHGTWRRIEAVGLVQEYKNKESDRGKWLRQLFGLMYLESGS
ncbi:hypothetical protein AGLY_002066 [Aphis glycines]|uniref:FLYWCH-type domain-containing protein n=1 Tax=Aphis glycines TaxID=307491 RepID=A0A6G0U4G8_APHGL|nr:hypothetical protein AGLY_002066 [Aphis glycines]